MTVHGVVTEVSPIKVSKKNAKANYFSRKITDGRATVRFVSFDPSLLRVVDGYCKEAIPIALSQCEVKETAGSRYEVIASPSRTKAIKSSKTFQLPSDLSALDPDTSVNISLEELQDLAVNQYVAVEVKAVLVQEVEEVQGKGTRRTLKKQDCIIADDSSTARLVL